MGGSNANNMDCLNRYWNVRSCRCLLLSWAVVELAGGTTMLLCKDGDDLQDQVVTDPDDLRRICNGCRTSMQD